MGEITRFLILNSASFLVAFSLKIQDRKEGTPTMGVILIWGTTFILAVGFWLFSLIFDGIFERLNFLSRSQTFLPLGALVFAAILGFADDLLGIFKIGPKGGGL